MPGWGPPPRLKEFEQKSLSKERIAELEVLKGWAWEPIAECGTDNRPLAHSPDPA